MNTSVLFFYALFAGLQLIAYIAVRRHWASFPLIAAITLFLSFGLMLFIALLQRNAIYQALFVALVLGVLFSGGVLAMATLFDRREARRDPRFAPLPSMPSVDDIVQDDDV